MKSKNTPLEKIITDSVKELVGKKIKDSLDHEYNALICQKQAEINALQSQINPHFLYNVLDSIRGQALSERSVELASMTEALATFFRYSISKKGNMVSLADEMKNVDNYLFIQRFRFGNKIEIIKKIEDEELMNCLIPKLTLQPIVENAIYHGLEHRNYGGASCHARFFFR